VNNAHAIAMRLVKVIYEINNHSWK